MAKRSESNTRNIPETGHPIPNAYLVVVHSLREKTFGRSISAWREMIDDLNHLYENGQLLPARYRFESGMVTVLEPSCPVRSSSLVKRGVA